MFSNNLSDAELERLAILAEELAEVGQVIGKIIRHGYESHNPTLVNDETNRRLLEKELGDVHHAIYRMAAAGDIKSTAIVAWADIKRQKIGKYLHHQPAGGEGR